LRAVEFDAVPSSEPVTTVDTTASNPYLVYR